MAIGEASAALPHSRGTRGEIVIIHCKVQRISERVCWTSSPNLMQLAVLLASLAPSGLTFSCYILVADFRVSESTIKPWLHVFLATCFKIAMLSSSGSIRCAMPCINNVSLMMIQHFAHIASLGTAFCLWH